MPAFNRKIEVTKEEFASVLLVLLIRYQSEEEMQKIAEAQNMTEKESTLELFGIDITNRKNLKELLEKLLVFNMWSVVASCETHIEDKNLCNECLDMFHLLVFKQYLKGKENDFRQWMLGIGKEYQEYYDATAKGGQLGPVYDLATLLNTKLYRKLNVSALVQFQIGNYIGSSMKAVQVLIKNYDIK